MTHCRRTTQVALVFLAILSGGALGRLVGLLRSSSRLTTIGLVGGFVLLVVLLGRWGTAETPYW